MQANKICPGNENPVMFKFTHFGEPLKIKRTAITMRVSAVSVVLRLNFIAVDNFRKVFLVAGDPLWT